MTIAQKIKESLMPEASKTKIKDVRIGLTYTAVLLENDQAGVALTFHEEMRRGCDICTGLQPLAGRKASELLAFLDSAYTIEMAVALDDTVGMVGYSAPLALRLKKKTSAILIFEQDKKRLEQEQDSLLPEEDAYRLLPQCQVAIITSTSILNHTVDNILDATRSCREIALLGASTPLLPEAFAGTSTTILSGVVISKPREVLQIVSEGGGTHFFKNNVIKVNLPLHTLSNA
jgi:uncharacterized protein (DUF4213/DUF364 family)